MNLVAVEGIEPTSLDYQSSALAVELHREVVDPTGLKPAPHGLKGRRSATRAPGQDIRHLSLDIFHLPFQTIHEITLIPIHVITLNR